MRILIVDDDELVLKSLSDVFSMNGYPNESFTNPADAIQAIRNSPFDVVITDCRMPDMDCFDIIQNVRKIQKETRVIVITGYNHYYSCETALERGAYGFFRKPLDIEELLRTIEDIRLQKDHPRPCASTHPVNHELSRVADSGKEIE